MTQDEVLKELRIVIYGNQKFKTWTISTPHIVELVNRAIKQEREACALICAKYDNDPLVFVSVDIAKEIRARR